MQHIESRRAHRAVSVSVVRGISFVLVAAALSGCLSTRAYVDPGLPDVKAEEIVKPETPRPVQVLFEFQTNGAPNTRATTHFKTPILDLVGNAGMFSAASADPAGNGDLLSIVINNVADMKDATSKGMTTGLTFGLAGNMVTDRYICTMTYSRGGSRASIVKTVNHAIHTTIGNHEGPPGLTPYPSIDAAATKAFEQMVRHGLKQLSQDPAFRSR